MKIHKVFLLIKALSIVGILIASYLLWEQLFRPPFQICSINATINCDAIISGAVAKTLGIPTPLYGLLGYVAIFVSAVYMRKKVLLNIALGGLCFCLWIAYEEIFILHVICPLCIFCQLIMVTIVGLGVFLNRGDSS